MTDIAELINNTSYLDSLKKHYGLISLELDRYCYFNKPDLVIWDRIDYNIFSTYTQREFTAPIFHWKTGDNRRFSGKLTLLTLQREYKIGCRYNVITEMDYKSMLEELSCMIKRSIERGADDVVSIL